MMGFRGWVVGLFGDEIRVVYECRECGTNLPPCDAQYPYFGPTDVVHLELLD